MTPELRILVRDRARSLQIRLNHGRLDAVTAGLEAKRLFVEAASDVHVRWLDLELNGYGAFSGPSLQLVLGDVPAGRLTAHVLAYRTQHGIASSAPITLFFVESLPDLVSRSRAVTEFATTSFDVEFVSSGAHAGVGRFGIDTFERILAGFFAALHLQLGVLSR